MRFKIHRGSNEIGGNCIELESQGKRLFLDFGMPLILPEGGEFCSRSIKKHSREHLTKKGYLPDSKGLYENDADTLGVLISHAHQDHYGFLNFLNKNISVYCGVQTKKLIDLTCRFTGMDVGIPNYKEVFDRQEFSLGPFKITPYLVDHSAFDAYAFLIEADGKRFFYSGDLRAHGRKYWCFPNLLIDLPRDIDIMMVETTMFGRQEEGYVKEEDLEPQMVDLMKETDGMVFLDCSAQNIDRIVSAYRACIQSDRIFIMDGYTASVYRDLAYEHLPHDSWEKVRVYFNKNHMIKAIRENDPESLLFAFKDSRIKGQEIAASPERFVMMFRQSMIGDFNWKAGLSKEILKNSSYIYSQWKGYLKKQDRLLSFLKENNVSGPHHIHCSGHIYVSDLRRLIDSLNPKKIAPIHGFETDLISDYYDNVVNTKDDEWVEV